MPMLTSYGRNCMKRKEVIRQHVVCAMSSPIFLKFLLLQQITKDQPRTIWRFFRTWTQRIGQYFPNYCRQRWLIRMGESIPNLFLFSIRSSRMLKRFGNIYFFYWQYEFIMSWIQVFIFPRDTELFTTVSTSLAVAHAKLNNSHDAIKALEAAEPAIVSLATANFSDSAELESLISQRSQLYSQLFESTGQIDKAESALRKSHEQKLISWNDLGTSSDL